MIWNGEAILQLWSNVVPAPKVLCAKLMYSFNLALKKMLMYQSIKCAA